MKTKTAIRSMRPEDIDQIYEIETASFTSPWTKDSFYHELLENPYAHYLVIEKDGCLAGYCGIWIIIDDAQITNIAIKPEYRGQSLGEALFRSAIELCREKRQEGSLSKSGSQIIPPNPYIKNSVFRPVESENNTIQITGKMRY